MAEEKLESFLSGIESKIESVLVSEIDRHADGLSEEHYGYALLPGEPYSVTSVVAAYNAETDISDEYRQETYYRYSVDEWKNYAHEGFINTNCVIEQLNNEFRELHPKDPNSYVMDQVESDYICRLLDSILAAMRHSRSSGSLKRFEYAVIWISNSGHEILNRSALELNSESIYKKYASEFAN